MRSPGDSNEHLAQFLLSPMALLPSHAISTFAFYETRVQFLVLVFKRIRAHILVSLEKNVVGFSSSLAEGANFRRVPYVRKVSAFIQVGSTLLDAPLARERIIVAPAWHRIAG